MFGGGMTMEKGGRLAASPAPAVNTPRRSQASYQRASNRDGAKALSRSVIVFTGDARRAGNKKSRRRTYFSRGCVPADAWDLRPSAVSTLLQLLDTAPDQGLGHLWDDLPGDLPHHAIGQPLHQP